GGERLVWGSGDGSDLAVYTLPFGRVGGLICWENYMPLARYALAAWGAQIHVAPTWDRGEPWLSTMRHVAKEGRAVAIGCAQAGRGWGMWGRKAEPLRSDAARPCGKTIFQIGWRSSPSTSPRLKAGSTL